MIKVTEKNRKGEQTQGGYPCLKIFKDGEIVLFRAKKEGICLNRITHYFGYYSTGWAEGDAKLYIGTLELSNGKE